MKMSGETWEELGEKMEGVEMMCAYTVLMYKISKEQRQVLF